MPLAEEQSESAVGDSEVGEETDGVDGGLGFLSILLRGAFVGREIALPAPSPVGVGVEMGGEGAESGHGRNGEEMVDREI